MSITSNHYIPQCLLLQIVLLLPPKSLFMFKCVSKSWNSLISDPSFMRDYASRFKEDSLPWALLWRFDRRCGLVPPEYVGVEFVTSNHSAFNFNNSPEKGRSVCRAASGDLYLFGDSDVFKVFNLSTKQWIKLPPSQDAPWNLGVGLTSKVQNGVAHYKVVRIVNATYSGPLEYERRGKNIFHFTIFSSGTGNWRDVTVHLPEQLSFGSPFLKAIPFNGVLHWLAHQSGKMIAYDPNNVDQIQLIKMPMSSGMSGMNMVLDVCRGNLRLFEVANLLVEPQSCMSWSIWVLEDYHKGDWCLEQACYSMDLGSLNPSLGLLSRPTLYLTPIAFHPMDMNIMYFSCQGYILQYNIITKMFDRDTFYSIPPIWNCISSWAVFPVLLPSCPIPAVKSWPISSILLPSCPIPDANPSPVSSTLLPSCPIRAANLSPVSSISLPSCPIPAANALPQFPFPASKRCSSWKNKIRRVGKLMKIFRPCM